MYLSVNLYLVYYDVKKTKKNNPKKMSPIVFRFILGLRVSGDFLNGGHVFSFIYASSQTRTLLLNVDCVWCVCVCMCACVRVCVCVCVYVCIDLTGQAPPFPLSFDLMVSYVHDINKHIDVLP